MKTKTLFNMYGGRAAAIPVICSFIGGTNKRIYMWGEVVPLNHAIKIYFKSGKKVPLELEDYMADKIPTRRYKC